MRCCCVCVEKAKIWCTRRLTTLDGWDFFFSCFFFCIFYFDWFVNVSCGCFEIKYLLLFLVQTNGLDDYSNGMHDLFIFIDIYLWFSYFIYLLRRLKWSQASMCRTKVIFGELGLFFGLLHVFLLRSCRFSAKCYVARLMLCCLDWWISTGIQCVCVLGRWEFYVVNWL